MHLKKTENCIKKSIFFFTINLEFFVYRIHMLQAMYAQVLSHERSKPNVVFKKLVYIFVI